MHIDILTKIIRAKMNVLSASMLACGAEGKGGAARSLTTKTAFKTTGLRDNEIQLSGYFRDKTEYQLDLSL